MAKDKLNGIFETLKLPGAKALVMGIVNLTPDSFYSQSRANTESEIIETVERMMTEGVDILDVGAYSSRPNADDISSDEEINRLLFGIQALRKVAPHVPISIDTFRADVVEKMFDEFGSFMVNDIAAGELDENMFETVARLELPYIAMHMKGNPRIMQNNPQYDNLMQEIIDYFARKIERLQALGVNDIIIDPGFGFGKTLEHNYKLLANFSDLHIFNLPLLVGFSRKSMLYKLLNIQPEDALNATTVVNTLALNQGAKILRVHDVAVAVEAVNIFEKLKVER